MSSLCCVRKAPDQVNWRMPFYSTVLFTTHYWFKWGFETILKEAINCLNQWWWFPKENQPSHFFKVSNLSENGKGKNIEVKIKTSLLKQLLIVCIHYIHYFFHFYLTVKQSFLRGSFFYKMGQNYIVHLINEILPTIKQRNYLYKYLLK